MWFMQQAASWRAESQTSCSTRVFCRMRTIRFPETFQSPLELNGASKIIIKPSTRCRRSIGSDWSADFLWSGGDNLFDLSWLHLIADDPESEFMFLVEAEREGILLFFLSVSLSSWLSLSDSSWLLFVRKELPQWPQQALKRNYLLHFRTMDDRHFQSWSETLAEDSQLVFWAQHIFLLLSRKISFLCGGGWGFLFFSLVKESWRRSGI